MVEDLERSMKHVMPGMKIRVSAGSVNTKHPLMWFCSYPKADYRVEDFERSVKQ